MTSVTRLGNFWKFLVTIFLTIVAQIFGLFGGYFQNFGFSSINCHCYFWVTFGKKYIWSHWTFISLVKSPPQIKLERAQAQAQNSIFTTQVRALAHIIARARSTNRYHKKWLPGLENLKPVQLLPANQSSSPWIPLSMVNFKVIFSILYWVAAWQAWSNIIIIESSVSI